MGISWGRTIPAALIFGAFVISPTLANGAEPALADIVSELNARIDQQQVNSNHIWTMTAAALVLLMQFGFLLLEAGMVRSKNSINVAQKNVTDFFIAVTGFYAIGFPLMFGINESGFFGSLSGLSLFNMVDDWTYTFFVFQAVFVGTAATIVSGAVAERMKFSGYLIMSALISMLIYPVFGQWAWGNLLNSDNTAWLADKGFIDFAGSTVVHSVGGWVALAGIVVLGARLGRFDEKGKPVRIQGHSMVLAGGGAMVLLTGWIGFNAGSTTAGTPDFARVAANTIIAASFGGAAAMLAGRALDGLFLPSRSINGLLGGLVGITAGCFAVDPHGAAMIGLACGLVVIVSEEFILRVLKQDDVVGAVSVHGVGGAVGTVLVAFFAMPEHLGAASRVEQLVVQLTGVGTAFAWAFGVSFIVFKAIDLTIGLRVSREEEEEGLNVAEHGASLGTGELQKMLASMIQGQADLSVRLKAEPGDEAGELAGLFNMLLTRLERDEKEKTKTLSQQAAYAEQERETVAEISRIIQSARAGDLANRLSLNGKSGMIATVSEGINGLFDAMSGVVGDLRHSLEAMAQGELRELDTKGAAGEFAAIRLAYNKTATAMSEVISSVKASTAEIDMSARTLDQSSRGVMERSETQRELIATSTAQMADVASTLAAMTSTAAEAAGAARDTAALSNGGMQQAGEAIDLMHNIRAASDRAQSFVKIIEDVAFQTNLLALNASVEAARAGEAGAGFNVVASEVRALADRVKNQSREISAIMRENATLVGSGVAKVREIGSALERISGMAEASATIVNDMAGRSRADAATIASAKALIDDINKMMDETAVESRETAAIAARLTNFAGMLGNRVSRFRLAGEDDGLRQTG